MRGLPDHNLDLIFWPPTFLLRSSPWHQRKLQGWGWEGGLMGYTSSKFCSENMLALRACPTILEWSGCDYVGLFICLMPVPGSVLSLKRPLRTFSLKHQHYKELFLHHVNVEAGFWRAFSKIMLIFNRFVLRQNVPFGCILGNPRSLTLPSVQDKV